MAHAKTAPAALSCLHSAFAQPVPDPVAMLRETILDFECDIASSINFIDFMTEHGDREAEVVAAFIKPLLVRHQLVGSLMTKLVNTLPPKEG